MADDKTPRPADHQPERGMTPLPQDPEAMQIVFDELTRSVSNFPTDRLERFYMESLAESPDVLAGHEWEGEFAIRYWYAHRVTINDDDVGPIEATRIVLIDPDGHAIKFVSEGVRRDLFRIIACFGGGELDPPVTVRVRQIQTSGKKSVTRLVAVPPRKTPRNRPSNRKES